MSGEYNVGGGGQPRQGVKLYSLAENGAQPLKRSRMGKKLHVSSENHCQKQRGIPELAERLG